MFLGTFFLFTEIPREWRRGLQADQEDDEEEDDVSIEENVEDILKQKKDLLNQDPDKIDFSKIHDDEKDLLCRVRPNMKGVIVSLIIFLIHFNGFAVIETITTPISTDIMHKYTDTLDYPESFAYVLFVCSGVLSLITFMVLKRINDLLSDKTFVMISSCMGLVGYFILIDFSPRIIEPARFIVGFCIISITFPFGRGVTLSMFSKMIGKHKAGAYMGYMLAIGAISRIVGPFWSVQGLTVGPSLTFGISAFLFLINIMIQWYWNDDLNPHWSYYIEEYELSKEPKEIGAPPNHVNPSTPGGINPMSPNPGYIGPSRRSPHKKSSALKNGESKV